VLGCGRVFDYGTKATQLSMNSFNWFHGFSSRVRELQHKRSVAERADNSNGAPTHKNALRVPSDIAFFWRIAAILSDTVRYRAIACLNACSMSALSVHPIVRVSVVERLDIRRTTLPNQSCYPISSYPKANDECGAVRHWQLGCVPAFSRIVLADEPVKREDTGRQRIHVSVGEGQRLLPQHCPSNIVERGWSDRPEVANRLHSMSRYR
jgi:hypothetical protein